MNYRSRIVVGVGGKQLQANWNETDPTSPQFIQNKPDISGALTRQVVQELPTQDIDPNCIYMIPVEDPEQGNYYEEWMYIDNNWEQIGSTAVEQVQSDWNEDDTTSPAYINNKPTIPTVNNATLTIQTNGQTAGTFTANADTNTTIDIEVPEYTSDLINDTDVYLTEEEYAALEAAGNLDEDINYHIRGEIPTKTSDLQNDSGFITLSEVPEPSNHYINIQKNGTEIGWFRLNQDSDKDINITVPTQTSDLVNDTDWYGTQAEFDALEQQGQLDENITYHVETEFADVAISGDYNDLINAPTLEQSDWNENDSTSLAYIKNKPMIPTKLSDLENDTDWYGTQAEFDLLPSYDENKIYHIQGTVQTPEQSDWNENDSTSLAYIKNKPNLATVATTGDYTDLTNTPTIPAAQVQSDWNASSGMGEILNKPNLATVATSGSYSDLSNTPSGLVQGYNGTAYTIRYISQNDYDNLGTYDANTIYLIY